MQKKIYRVYLINNAVARLPMVKTPARWPPGFLEEKCANPKQALDLIKVIDDRNHQNKIYLKDVQKNMKLFLTRKHSLKRSFNRIASAISKGGWI